MSVLSFAEESCWDGETFRSIRRPIVFVLTATVPGRETIHHEFTSDYGVFYDVSDDWMIVQLQDRDPTVDWGRFVYWKAVDHSRIQIIDPDDDSQIGEIVPRGVQNPRISADRLPEGVVSLSRWRENRERTGQKGDCTESN